MGHSSWSTWVESCTSFRDVKEGRRVSYSSRRWCMSVESVVCLFFFFSSRRRHTRYIGDWSDVCSSDLHRSRTPENRDHNLQRLPILVHVVNYSSESRERPFADAHRLALFEFDFELRPILRLASLRSEERRVANQRSHLSSSCRRENVMG